MSFGREKRLLLGWLAALAPLPLPFGDVLEWSFMLAYWLAVAVFLYRAAEGAEEWLPAWALNVIGLAYLPVVYLDFTRFWGGQILRPLLHLASFALVVKLFALTREREKWHILIGIFFLFLASMGSSVHPSVLLYLVVFLGLVLVTLARFAALHFLVIFRQPAATLAEAPWTRLVVGTTLAIVLLATVLFPILPRIGQPYLVARTPGAGGRQVQSSGFSDVMTLDGIGRIRTNNEVALRLRYDMLPPGRHELRYKGATYDRFEGQSWRQSPLRPERLERGEFDLFHLQDGAPSSWVAVWQEPLGVRNLFVPNDTVAIEIAERELALDDGGAVFTRRRSPVVREYRLALGEEAGSVGSPPAEDGQTLDLTGVSERMRDLAGAIMGDGPLRERIQRLEEHLLEEYEYTLDLLGRGGEDQIESFLFEERRGHCEYFASAMVLMLRSQNVHARLVTGFLGGERSPLGDYFIVRQSNAHAWVEAHLPGEGWRVFEPTPPSGRPIGNSGSFWGAAMHAYDYLIFRWDRYVLTFGAADQVGLLASLRELWGGLKDLVFGDPDAVGERSRETPAQPSALPQEHVGLDRERSLAQRWWWVAPVAALLVGLWFLLRRPPFDATQAYRELRRRARRQGVDLPDSVAPLALAGRLEEVWPEASAAVEPIVERYLEESFGGRPLAEGEAEELRERLRDASVAMRRAA